jgi:hypothetical protein
MVGWCGEGHAATIAQAGAAHIRANPATPSRETRRTRHRGQTEGPDKRGLLTGTP